MNAEAKKKAFKNFHYGIYVLTARDGEEVSAATVTWVAQASFEPPLFSVAIRRDSKSHALVKASKKLVLHVLGEGQKELAAAFFKAAKFENGRLNGYPTEPSPNHGIPVLKDAPYWLEAEVEAEAGGGDHTVFLCRVVEAGVGEERPALCLRDTGWSYGG